MCLFLFYFILFSAVHIFTQLPLLLHVFEKWYIKLRMVFQITVITFRMRCNKDWLLLVIVFVVVIVFFPSEKKNCIKQRRIKWAKLTWIRAMLNEILTRNAYKILDSSVHKCRICTQTNTQTHTDIYFKPMEYILCTLTQYVCVQYTFHFCALFFASSRCICQWNYAFTPYYTECQS